MGLVSGRPVKPVHIPLPAALLISALTALLLGVPALAQVGSPRLFQQAVAFKGEGGAIAEGTLMEFDGYLDSSLTSVFFDQVRLRYAVTPTSFEVMKQHVIFAEEGMNTIKTGWRFDGFVEDLALGIGDEVQGGWEINTEELEPISHDWLRDTLRAMRLSAYGTAGLRGMRIEDDFLFDATGSILGRTMVATMVDHDLFGPQLGVGIVAEASMFRFEAVVLGLVGYGHAEIKQTGVFGEVVIPGALNRSAVARATYSSAPKITDDYVAWQGEARLTASCQLTQSLRFDAMWRGVLTGPIRNSAVATAWNAPDFGIHDINGETIDFGHWFFGLTYTR